jgi:hypothetical protein
MNRLAACAGWGAMAVVALWPVSGRTCGACVEDRVALVYDHAVVRQAAASGGVVVFCDVHGNLDLTRLSLVARGAPGVKPDSVRVSRQPAVLSFAVQPRTITPADAVQGMQRALGKSMQLSIVHLLAPEPRPAP